jgi:hypothetical protein
MSLTERAIHAIATTLIPFFLGDDNDPAAAHAAARQTLDAYNPKSLTDYIAAARAIGFSLGALAATGKAMDPALPEPRQHQYLTKATGFARLAQKAEAALEKARQHRPANTQPASVPPVSTEPAALALPEDEDATIQTLVDHALIDKSMAALLAFMPQTATMAEPSAAQRGISSAAAQLPAG